MRPDAILFIPQQKKLRRAHDRNITIRKVRLGGVEPPTPALGEPRSIHLSYRRKFP